ncbi:hypothetical protein [Pseudoneobacillus sp. C159]
MNNLTLYKNYRQVGIDLNTELIQQVDVQVFVKAASLLELFEKGNVVIKQRQQSDYLYDFVLHENLNNEYTMVEKYKASYTNEDELKTRVLDAFLSSYTSLFKIVSVTPETSTLELEDLLNPDRENLFVTDLNFSKKAKPNLLLFTRILPFNDLFMLSGSSFIFKEEHETFILTRYKKLVKKVPLESESAKRFVAFYQLNQTDGLISIKK